MPIAIAFSTTGAIPGVIYEDTSEALVRALRKLKEAPALETEEDARLWLQSLPAPSGWFASTREAKAHLKRWQEAERPPTNAEVPADTTTLH